MSHGDDFGTLLRSVQEMEKDAAEEPSTVGSDRPLSESGRSKQDESSTPRKR
jgi:hypothetical protein